MLNPEVTMENYYSPEMAWKYSTNSQRKTFVECPSKWMACIRGEWVEDDKPVFLHGRYVDVALTESPTRFAQFCEREQAKIYGKNGKKFKVFLDLDEAINIVRREERFMFYLKGEGQAILAFEDFHGCKVKMRLDNVNHVDIPDYHDEPGFFSDLKTCASITGRVWIERNGKNIKVHFATAYDYFTQIAIYQEGLRLAYDKLYPAFIPAMEKTDPFNREVFWVSQDQEALYSRMGKALEHFTEMQEIKDANTPSAELKKCGGCDYCIKNKVLHRPTPLTPELID